MVQLGQAVQRLLATGLNFAKSTAIAVVANFRPISGLDTTEPGPGPGLDHWFE